MCCFRLHFSDFNVLFFQQNKKTCCSLLLKKIFCCAKREKKITCRGEKSQPPPLDIKWSVPYCCALLFPVDSVTKQAIIGGGQKSVFSSFLADFSARLAQSISSQSKAQK